MQFSDAGDDCEAEPIAASLAVAAAVDASEGCEHLAAQSIVNGPFQGLQANRLPSNSPARQTAAQIGGLGDD